MLSRSSIAVVNRATREEHLNKDLKKGGGAGDAAQ
jgi:hypothetical protein